MKAITDTGVRGYLKWLQQDQPELYKAIAPHLVQKSKHAFSDHEQSLALGALAQADGAASGTTTTFDASTDPFSGASATATDVASAANVGAASPSVVQDITNLITGALNAKANYDIAETAKQQFVTANNQQLAIAAAGGQPLGITSSSLGIPIFKAATSAGGLGAGTVLALVAVAWFLFGRGKRV